MQETDVQKFCPCCGEKLNAQAIMCRFCGAGISPDHFTECPFCSEMVRFEAAICRFCKSNLARQSSLLKSPNDSNAAAGKAPNQESKLSETAENLRAIRKMEDSSRLYKMIKNVVHKDSSSNPPTETPTKEELAQLDKADVEIEYPSLKETDVVVASAGFNYVVIREREKLILQKLQKNYGQLETVKEDIQIEIRRVIREMVQSDSAPLTMMEKGVLLQNVLDEVFGFGPLGPLLRNPSVGDICVNSYDSVFVEREYRLEKTSVRFENEAHLRQCIDKITGHLGLHLNEATPIVNMRLPNGSRVNATLSQQGATLTLRCFPNTFHTLGKLVELGTMNLGVAEILKACVKARINILICGPELAGKSTLMSALGSHIKPHERLISVSHTNELQFQHEHWVRLEADSTANKSSVLQLIGAALQMRADRLFVNELLGAESFELLQALLGRLSGTITTMRANSTQNCVHRLEARLLTHDDCRNSETARSLIGETIQLIVFMIRHADGSVRVAELAEVCGTSNGEVVLNRVLQLVGLETDSTGQSVCKYERVGENPRFLNQILAEDIPFNSEWLQ